MDAESLPSTRRRRALMRRTVLVGAAAFAILVVLASVSLAAVGWHYSGVLRDDALSSEDSPDAFDLVVASAANGLVELVPTGDASPTGAWTQDGNYGLVWDGGWALVGDIVERGDGHVLRSLEGGTLPPTGVSARLDTVVYPGDPGTAHGLPFNDVDIAGPGGSLPAWLIPGEKDVWVIGVHGKNSSRREALRVAPVLHSLDLPFLVITYRNDDGAPASPDGYVRYGATEWLDQEAAVRYAADHGAEGVVLLGYSMGAGVILSFMGHSALAGKVDALILDAPMISLDATVDFQAANRGVWPIVTNIGKRFASWRFDVDWDATDYRGVARAVAAPVLIFHGTADRTTPLAESAAWANDRPGNVHPVTVEAAGHVRSWNTDQQRYEAEVRAFLSQVLATPN